MKNKVKVIQLIDSLNPGGAEMMAVNIANGLADKGVQSHICVTRLEGSLKSKIASSVGYLFLNKKNILDLKALKKLNKYIRENKIGIIHAHSSSYFFAFLIKIRIPKVKIIWHDHYGYSENLLNRSKFPLNLISNSFYAIISVNNLLEQWSKRYLKTKNVYFIPNFASLGMNIPKITFLSGKEGKKIVCLANLRPQKDHLNLLRAFEIVHKQYLDWTLHLVGLDLKDTYSTKIKNFITEKKLVNSVFLYNSCADTAHILAQATIGVLASKSEGLPVSLLEYGLVKLPVVITNVGDCNKVVQNKVNGLLVEPTNDEKLAGAIIKLIANSELRMNLGANLCENVRRNFSKENYISKLINIYN
ncbi:Alpha-1,4-N-acetylgalactosamine transferase PglH [hydrothermal vent metagenome]|uniref:Alpha-1,4-N-acetylgalactosamine transferase PglH n=1 Tax=hydrothermal vent metagenome TaxID=652676 RepID=A0A3B0TW67_9ZZZZ